MIEYLKWDSDFFDLKIGKIEADQSTDLKEQLVIAEKERYRLLYVFCDKHFNINTHLLKEHNGKLVDRKVIFEKSILDPIKISNSLLIKEYTQPEANANLIHLALESGKYSRFKLDLNFHSNAFKNLYTRWIKKSVEGKLADKVFVIYANDKEIAMITVMKKNNRAQIGLIATHEDYRGYGYGKKLLQQVEEYAIKNDITHIEVATQLDNKAAISFYEKCNYKIKSIHNIYHFWR